MITYKSIFNRNFDVYILKPSDGDRYRQLLTIMPAGDIAFTSLDHSLILIDGVQTAGLSKDHIRFIEAHEIAHHKLNHKTEHGSAAQEAEADLGAYLLLAKFNFKSAMKLVVRYWASRHSTKFNDYLKINSNRIANKMKIDVPINEDLITERVIKPNMSFVATALNANRVALLACKSNAACKKVLNTAFNNYWILVDSSKTADEDCLVRNWSIDTASTIPTTESPDGSIVELIIGKSFSQKIQGISSASDWIGLVNAINIALEHEYIHKVHVTKIPGAVLKKIWSDANVNDDIKYLSIPQEIMAFARQSVLEFQAAGATRDELLQRVRTPYSTSVTPAIVESDIFHTYTHVFKPNDTVMRRFLKYMYEYIS